MKASGLEHGRCSRGDAAVAVCRTHGLSAPVPRADDEKPLASQSHACRHFHRSSSKPQKEEEKKTPQESWELLGCLCFALKEGWGQDRGPQRGLVASVAPEYAGCLCMRWLQALGAAEGLHGTHSSRAPCQGGPGCQILGASQLSGTQVGKATTAVCSGTRGHQGPTQPSATSALYPRDWAGSGFWSSTLVREPKNVSCFPKPALHQQDAHNVIISAIWSVQQLWGFVWVCFSFFELYTRG